MHAITWWNPRTPKCNATPLTGLPASAAASAGAATSTESSTVMSSATAGKAWQLVSTPTGHIKCNDLGSCTLLSLIPGPSWLYSSSLVLMDLVVTSFADSKIAVTIDKWPVHSIAKLQVKLPLSFGIQSPSSPQESKIAKHFAVFTPTIPSMCGHQSIQSFPQAFGDFTGSSATSSSVVRSGTWQRKRSGDVIPAPQVAQHPL